jgi:hypothetical protein
MNSAQTDTMGSATYNKPFLTTLAVVNLILGLVFYVIPGPVITSWPWPVKELAVRFLGAIFLAIAQGCWSAIQAKTWQRGKILVLVGATFFGLTGIVSAVHAATINNIDTWSWTIFFLAASVGCLTLLKLNGWHRKQIETPTTLIPATARIFFAIQTSVVGIFGAMMVLTPALAQDQFWPWKVATETIQTFGALFLATCLATGWAFLQKDTKRILVLLPLDAVFPTLALLAVGISWNLIVAESPSWLVTGVWIFLYSFVALGSTLLYFTLKR